MVIKMDNINKFVSEMLGAFNGIIAIILILGTFIAAGNAGGGFGLMIPLAGLILTIIACGIVAVLIDIKNEISKMSGKLDKK